MLSPADEARVETLAVAMALAPGVYARNRMFAFFATSGVQRAKARAATLRGVIRHLGRASGVTLEATGEASYVLRYQIPVVHLSRVVELSRVELATLRVLAVRAGVTTLAIDENCVDEDRTLVETALGRLLAAGGEADALARAAQHTTSLPPPPE
jgi:hypothetical protein